MNESLLILFLLINFLICKEFDLNVNYNFMNYGVNLFLENVRFIKV